MPGSVLLPFDTGAYSNPTACILSSLTSGTPAARWAVTAGDQVNLVLAPRTNPGVAGQSTTSNPIAAGSSIVVSGKLITALDADSLLFEAINFTHSTDGNGNDLYTGLLNLNTTELDAAIPTGVQSVAVMLVIDIIDPSGYPQRYLCAITVYNETYSGSEGSPTPATPTFLTGAQTQAQFLNNWNFITDIAGGTATSLNGQATAGVVALGTQVGLRGISTVNGGGYTIWEFAALPSSAPVQQLPADWNASSNNFTWIKVL
jgi:hypothetical protein